MSDNNYDELIGLALHEFHDSEALAAGPAGGPAVVRATVAHRRKVRITTYSVLGALLIAIPVAAFAANPRGNNSPPLPDNVMESQTPEPTRAPEPVKDGRFNAEELIGLSAPAFDEPACGKQIAAKPQSNVDKTVYVKQVVHTNLDSDPQPETAALLVCMLEDESSRVVAFDRDGDGKPVSLGVVVGRLDINDVTGIKARSAGGIIATVDFSTHSPEPGDPAPQEREYAWDGAKFAQVGGPTAFVRAKAALSLTAAPLRLKPEPDGKWSGTLTLTLRNDGPQDSLAIDIELATSHRITVQGHLGNLIRQEPVKAGQSRTVTLTVVIDVGAGQTPLSFGAQLYSYAQDPDNGDDFVQIEVTQ